MVKKNIFWNISIRHSVYLLIYVIMAFILNEILIIGNDYIAKATDNMLSGEEVIFSSFLVPLLVMVIAGSAASYIKSISGNDFSVRVQRDVKSQAGRRLIELPYCYFDEKGTGSIMTKLISDVGEAGRFFSEILPELLINIITVATVTVYIVGMDVSLVIVLFVSYPVMLLIADRLSKRLERIAKRWRGRMDDRADVAYDAIQGIAVGRSYQLYDIMKRKIDGIIDDIADQACKSTRISSAGYVMQHTLTLIPVIFCYLFALREVLTGKITTGEMLAFTVLIGRIMYPLADIVFCVNDICQIGVSLNRIQEIFEYEKESGGTGNFKAEGSPVISVQNLVFSYDGTNPVLNNASFTVKAGEKVAFVGGSGEGKSTIFRILCGFYKKQSGKYELFGHEFDEWELSAARNCFSVVSQNVFLFPESIRQNVAYGREDATREEIIEACKNANIHDFIMNLPEGYDTLAGERGVRLSGGEKQRISIARAFLKNAPILLLDEPTAAIDEKTEKLIQEAIDRISEGKTVLTIAHRLSTIKNSDRIYVIEKGRVAESGTHESLLALNGIYGGLYGKENE